MTSSEPKNAEPNNNLTHLFSAVITAYVVNMLRAGEARVAQMNLMAAAVPLIASCIQTTPHEKIEGLSDNFQQALNLLMKVTRNEYEAWSYVTKLSYYIYYTTLFDTFLQDTLEFLLFAHPSAISDYNLSFSHVLNSQSRHDILNMAINTKVRELARILEFYRALEVATQTVRFKNFSGQGP